MQTTNFNPVQLFASILERDTSVTKNEFIKRVRLRLDTSRPELKRLSQLVSQLPFFQVSKTSSGQIIVN